jgi:ABC-type Fe3+-hydroxamate transport system substrate-binding protein
MTIEEILTADPDIIVDFSSADGGTEKAGAATDAELLRAWKDAPTLRAVRSGHIHLLRDPHLAVPGPAMGRVAARFAEIIRGDTAASRGDSKVTR